MILAAVASDCRQLLRRSPSLRPIATWRQTSNRSPYSPRCYSTSSAAQFARLYSRGSTPTAMEVSGTSFMTTAFAPIKTLLPIGIGPKLLCTRSNIDIVANDRRPLILHMP